MLAQPLCQRTQMPKLPQVNAQLEQAELMQRQAGIALCHGGAGGETGRIGQDVQ